MFYDWPEGCLNNAFVIVIRDDGIVNDSFGHTGGTATLDSENMLSNIRVSINNPMNINHKRQRWV